MKRVLFLGGLTVWFFSCNGKDHGSGQGPATDTTVNVTTSTPNNATGSGATNMGGDTGTVSGAPSNQTMTNSGAGGNMNGHVNTATSGSDTSMNRNQHH